MSKHRNADQKLVSRDLRKDLNNTHATPSHDYTAPQIPKPRTNSRNQYR